MSGCPENGTIKQLCHKLKSTLTGTVKSFNARPFRTDEETDRQTDERTDVHHGSSTRFVLTNASRAIYDSVVVY